MEGDTKYLFDGFTKRKWLAWASHFL